MCAARCPRILLQDKYKDAFPCLFLCPLTHIPITSQEVGIIFLHAFPKKHVWFSIVRPPPQEVGRLFLHAFPSEACLALGSETTSMCCQMRHHEDKSCWTQHALLRPSGHNICPWMRLICCCVQVATTNITVACWLASCTTAV